MADARILRDLAEEVERLEMPIRAINLRIWRACAPGDAERAYWNQRPMISKGTPDDEAAAIAWGRVTPPEYTRSIDAAAKLLPGRWSPEIVKVQHRWRARGIPPGGISVVGFGATEPLARTACALRALAADLEGADADPS